MTGYQRLVHSDWSKDPRKRWACEAVKIAGRWRVGAPRLVGKIDDFVKYLQDGQAVTLAGFDFPIGVPAAFGRATSRANFPDLLGVLGLGEWLRFFEVCDRPDEIRMHRPFYPRVSSAKAKQLHLLERHGVNSIDDLRRFSERATADRRAACSLFWTLGGNQVGKAAISGWQEVIRPLRASGARIWPFDGDLAELSNAGRLTLAETYPAEAYGHVGVRFETNGSKQRQADRRNATLGLEERCARYEIVLVGELEALIADGFGPRKSAEDSFDAVMGALGMIEVVEGRRSEAPAHIPERDWEGWIIGR